MALHDLALAARYCSRLLLMHQGRLVADGPPQEVLNATNAAKVFAVTGRFDPEGRYQVLETVP